MRNSGLGEGTGFKFPMYFVNYKNTSMTCKDGIIRMFDSLYDKIFFFVLSTGKCFVNIGKKVTIKTLHL